MDTLYFDLLKLGYHLGLAILVGGGLALGLVAAPAIFSTARSRAEGGTFFGNVLARYDALAIGSLVLVALTSVLRAIAFETVDPPLARWASLAAMAFATLYASGWTNPIARSIQRQTSGFDELPDSAPARREFMRLHRRSRRAMSLAIVAGLVSIFLS